MKTITYEIRLSTGAEINEPGTYALYLTIAVEDQDGPVEIDGSAHVWPSEPDDLALEDAIEWTNRHFGVPATAWEEAKSYPGSDFPWWEPMSQQSGDVYDVYGGYTVARAVVAEGDHLASPPADLMDADTAERIGPATIAQVKASDRAAENDGGTGIFAIDDEGHPVPSGSWDAQQPGVHRVYTVAGEDG